MISPPRVPTSMLHVRWPSPNRLHTDSIPPSYRLPYHLFRVATCNKSFLLSLSWEPIGLLEFRKEVHVLREVTNLNFPNDRYISFPEPRDQIPRYPGSRHHVVHRLTPLKVEGVPEIGASRAFPITSWQESSSQVPCKPYVHKYIHTHLPSTPIMTPREKDEIWDSFKSLQIEVRHFTSILFSKRG